MEKSQINDMDRAIMKRLGINARVPFSTLAKELGISNTMVHQRVNKLRQLGVLENATFRFNAKALGYSTEAITRIDVANAKYIPKIVAELEKIPEIIECSNISGKYALMIKVIAVDNNHLRDVLYGKIHDLEGVIGTDTNISFETAFQKNIELMPSTAQ
ncbi:Lrp/AsnC family transcriptional regulator [Reichenbachiella agariperforans]|uniref:Lrp/AsnC family transcriptional regulator, regulator for asnA, asnC and gidA n=1 Tax=Reichenbachiella agariperforans TaxID=156994 RepID=A0A1M6N0U4_REIAG|nr:Lrp/AsnC ligand binding domain-containing protein [Reichenbachiella agariperforans]MBU2915669.1 Lrp/AsnC ligand binding domain-containing protein [Reichenbachiella agariperforans]SHJ89263.1 Lrp/AsnC family transcriptional regulator, regulator for asnA, asnC and gidA [Reichenbachiella agariperforans]